MARTLGAAASRMSAKGRGDEGSGRLSREDWIDGAIIFLSRDRLEALTVNALAERLGVTKGSFYWHFDSREGLLDAVVDTWRRRMTSEIEGFIRNSVGSPIGRLRRIVRIAMAPRPDVPGGPLELLLRDLARRDARVADVVREVDARRLAFLHELYKEAGLDDEKAASYAFLHMSFVIGGRILQSNDPKGEAELGCKVGEEFLVP